MTKLNQLIIAEKKEVAKAIATAIDGQAGTPKDGAFHSSQGPISWCSGHLLKLIEPEDHSEAYGRWALEPLPMCWPADLVPIPDTAKQLKAVVALCRAADSIIHAGDPDPEGQLLVDEVLEYAGVTDKPTRRLLINDNNPAAIKKAMQSMPDNQDFYGLSRSAFTRSVCDQHYGINLTRLYTLLARLMGYDDDGVLSVGRVQTPILALIVRRDLAHEAHEKTPFYVISAAIEMAGTTVTAKYQPGPDDLVDDKQRLLNKVQSRTISDAVINQAATLERIDTKDKHRAAPLPFHLLALQAAAAQQFGYSPKQVLELTQNLRDRYQAITYNRSDCAYLNEERHAEAPAMIAALTPQFTDAANGADPALKSKAFNSAKVTAHHAIIPTANVPALTGLPEAESHIYQMIVLQYLAQFYPPETYRTTTAVFTVGERQFVAKGRVDVAPGWRVLFQAGQTDENTDEEEDKTDLEALQAGTSGTVAGCECKENFTKPLPAYTMSSLLKDLPRLAKYVSDPKIRKLLLDKDADKQDEAGGIGTPATRDSMIETLFKRGFVIEQGKKLVSTDLGRQFIAALPDFATTPDMTALWHEKQKQIEAGELDYQVLIDEVTAAVAAEVSRAKATGLPLKIDRSGQHACPSCAGGILKKRKGKFGLFWPCSNRETCGAYFKDNKGQPDLTPRPKVELSEHQCPDCAKPLIRRLAKPKKGQKGKTQKRYWWGCSGFKDGCKFTCFDKAGQPEINHASPA